MEKKAKFKFNKKKVSIFLIILIIFILGGAYFSKEKKDSYIKVDTAKVSKKKIVQTASATGNIEANYRNEIALNPAQKVGKVLVK